MYTGRGQPSPSLRDTRRMNSTTSSNTRNPLHSSVTRVNHANAHGGPSSSSAASTIRASKSHQPYMYLPSLLHTPSHVEPTPRLPLATPISCRYPDLLNPVALDWYQDSNVSYVLRRLERTFEIGVCHLIVPISRHSWMTGEAKSTG